MRLSYRFSLIFIIVDKTMGSLAVLLWLSGLVPLLQFGVSGLFFIDLHL